VKANQTPQLFENRLERTFAVRYLLFLPERYDSNGRQRWPLLLFLHGSGERGSSLSKVAAHGPPRIVKKKPEFPFVLISPQCPAGECWSNEMLLPLLDHVRERYNIDPGRIYLTGLSMGGYGVWNLATAVPEKFAAIAPVCGGGDLLPIVLAEPRKLRALRGLSVWAFHGEKDPVVPLQEAERMIFALRKVGNAAKLTVYPGVEHDCWTETYSNPALYKWFLDQRAAG
jgi:predicted peptidase